VMHKVFTRNTLAGISVAFSLVGAGLVTGAAQAGPAAATQTPFFDLSGFRLGMSADEVRGLVNAKMTNSDYSEPAFYDSASHLSGADFVPTTYLSRLSFKYRIYAIDVFLTETKTTSVVSSVSLHFQGNQLPLGYGEVTDPASVDRVKRFRDQALSKYGKPSLDNIAFFASKDWYGVCVLHNGQNLHSDLCRLPLLVWCASGIDPKESKSCAPGDVLELSRSGSEIQLFRASPDRGLVSAPVKSDAPF